MKYIFVVNPYAGKEESELVLLEQLKKRNFDFEIYQTKGPKDATIFVKTYCMKHVHEEVCFVGCGGDGTMNEIINGAYGYENACFSVFPCGSGNDYAKYFGGADLFLNVDNILSGEKIKVDVMEVNGRYAVNVVNFGLDCVVLDTMETVKRWPIIGGDNAYTTGVGVALIGGRNNIATVKADGEELNPSGHYCLCTIANGSHVGGSYNCAPRSIVNDGLMEVCMMKPVSLIKFVSCAKLYQEGKHLDHPKFKDCCIYRQARSVEITSPQPMVVSMDGEVISGTHFICENHPQALTFIQPKGAKVHHADNNG